MIDIAYQWQSSATATSEVLAAYDLAPGEYLLLTAHRAGNVDDPERLRAIADFVAGVHDRVIFPVHPRTRARLGEAGLLERLRALPNLTLTEPLGYVEFGALLRGARAVLTDSGGVQKEAYLASVPCVTLRSTTEWVETVQSGWNTLADLGDGAGVISALERPIPKKHPELYGDGKAAERCVAAIGKLNL